MEDGWEGCLSVPGMRGVVPRYSQLRYRGVDELGRAIDRRVSGFHARVVQHEVDHIDGILYPMRMSDMSQFGFAEDLFPGQGLEDDWAAARCACHRQPPAPGLDLVIIASLGREDVRGDLQALWPIE